MNIFIVTLFGFGIISLLSGIFFLIKFVETKNKLFLILGIILALVVPGIIIYIIFKGPVTPTMVYGPAPGVIYGPPSPPK
jgi:hypothetical protein